MLPYYLAAPMPKPTAPKSERQPYLRPPVSSKVRLLSSSTSYCNVQVRRATSIDAKVVVPQPVTTANVEHSTQRRSTFLEVEGFSNVSGGGRGSRRRTSPENRPRPSVETPLARPQSARATGRQSVVLRAPLVADDNRPLATPIPALSSSSARNQSDPKGAGAATTEASVPEKAFHETTNNSRKRVKEGQVFMRDVPVPGEDLDYVAEAVVRQMRLDDVALADTKLLQRFVEQETKVGSFSMLKPQAMEKSLSLAADTSKREAILATNVIEVAEPQQMKLLERFPFVFIRIRKLLANARGRILDRQREVDCLQFQRRHCRLVCRVAFSVWRHKYDIIKKHEKALKRKIFGRWKDFRSFSIMQRRAAWGVVESRISGERVRRVFHIWFRQIRAEKVLRLGGSVGEEMQQIEARFGHPEWSTMALCHLPPREVLLGNSNKKISRTKDAQFRRLVCQLMIAQAKRELALEQRLQLYTTILLPKRMRRLCMEQWKARYLMAGSSGRYRRKLVVNAFVRWKEVFQRVRRDEKLFEKAVGFRARQLKFSVLSSWGKQLVAAKRLEVLGTIQALQNKPKLYVACCLFAGDVTRAVFADGFRRWAKYMKSRRTFKQFLMEQHECYCEALVRRAFTVWKHHGDLCWETGQSGISSDTVVFQAGTLTGAHGITAAQLLSNESIAIVPPTPSHPPAPATSNASSHESSPTHGSAPPQPSSASTARAFSRSRHQGGAEPSVAGASFAASVSRASRISENDSAIPLLSLLPIRRPIPEGAIKAWALAPPVNWTGLQATDRGIRRVEDYTKLPRKVSQLLKLTGVPCSGELDDDGIPFNSPTLSRISLNQFRRHFLSKLWESAEEGRGMSDDSDSDSGVGEGPQWTDEKLFGGTTSSFAPSREQRLASVASTGSGSSRTPTVQFNTNSQSIMQTMKEVVEAASIQQQMEARAQKRKASMARLFSGGAGSGFYDGGFTLKRALHASFLALMLRRSLRKAASLLGGQWSVTSCPPTVHEAPLPDLIALGISTLRERGLLSTAGQGPSLGAVGGSQGTTSGGDFLSGTMSTRWGQTSRLGRGNQDPLDQTQTAGGGGLGATTLLNETFSSPMIASTLEKLGFGGTVGPGQLQGTLRGTMRTGVGNRTTTFPSGATTSAQSTGLGLPGADEVSSEPPPIGDPKLAALEVAQSASARQVFLYAGIKEHQRRYALWQKKVRKRRVLQAGEAAVRSLPRDALRMSETGDLVVDPVHAAAWVNRSIVENTSLMIANRLSASFRLKTLQLLHARVGFSECRGLRAHQDRLQTQPARRKKPPPKPLVRKAVDFVRVQRLVVLIAAKWRSLAVRCRKGVYNAAEVKVLVPPTPSESALINASLAFLAVTGGASSMARGSSPQSQRRGRGHSPSMHSREGSPSMFSGSAVSPQRPTGLSKLAVLQANLSPSSVSSFLSPTLPQNHRPPNFSLASSGESPANADTGLNSRFGSGARLHPSPATQVGNASFDPTTPGVAPSVRSSSEGSAVGDSNNRNGSSYFDHRETSAAGSWAASESFAAAAMVPTVAVFPENASNL